MKFRNAFRKTIVLSSCSLIYLIIYGTVRLNSQLFVVVREMFGADREQGSFPFTLLYSVKNLSGPFIGFFGKKFGLRCTTVFGCLLSTVSIAACFLVDDIIPFTILWGIGFGTGFGLSTTLIPNILHLHFTKTFNLVQGIFLSGASIGCFVLPGIAEHLLSAYGASGTFLIISGLVLNSVPLAMLLKCPEETPKIESHVEVKEKSEQLKTEECQYVLFEINKYSEDHITEKNVVFKERNLYSMERLDLKDRKSSKYALTNLPRDSFNFISRNVQVYLDPAYILICISFGVVMIAVSVLTTVMVDACRDIGVLEDVTILMTFAAGDIVGRLVFGYLADLKCTSPLNIYTLTCGFYGLLLIGFTWLNGFYSMVVFFAVVGVVMGGIGVTPTGVIRDYIEKENLTMAFSSRNFLFGLLNLSQPSVIGYFRETLQSYDGLFYFLGSICIFGTLVALCVPTAARYRDRKRRKKEICCTTFRPKR